MEDSEYVKLIYENGNKVIATHIDMGENFFEYEPEEHYDVIISNPPFSKKRILIERCLNFHKPFILLYGCTIFSQSMGNTLNRCSFKFIQHNCKFTTKNPNIVKSFQCC